MRSANSLRLVSCEGCRAAHAAIDKAMSTVAPRGRPSAALKACRERVEELERELEDLRTTLTSTEEELEASKEETRQAEENAVDRDEWGRANDACREALSAAREALHRWKLGAALKPTAAELAGTIAQIVPDLEILENLL
jgi:chromosome segregation ATPase